MPLLLRYLRVEYDVGSRITMPNGTTAEGRFSLLHCQSDAAPLQSSFLAIAKLVLESLRGQPSWQDLNAQLSGLQRYSWLPNGPQSERSKACGASFSFLHIRPIPLSWLGLGILIRMIGLTSRSITSVLT